MKKEVLNFMETEDGYSVPLYEAINSMNDVVLIFDKDSRVIYANDAYTKIFDMPKSKILGKRISDFEPHSPGLKVLETGKSKINVYNFVKSGNRDVVGDITPILQNGELIGAICVMRSIDTLFKLNIELQQIDRMPYWKRTLLSEQLEPVFKKLLGANEQFNKCLHLASHVAKTEASVLLLGKTGVGKDVFARAIHAASQYKDGPFVPINMAAIPETLMESELFGYDEGAFSGASKKGKVGKFEQANNGTLFLDEIGEMSLNTQAKLLRALQDRSIQKVGANKPIRINVRIIAATNRDLEEMVRNGEFRADLYYRLNIIAISIPKLIERKEDIKVLSYAFLERLNKKYNKSVVFAKEVLDAFEAYDWPGNVRELQSVIEQMVILANSPVLGIELIPNHFIKREAQNSMKKNSAEFVPEETNLHTIIGEVESQTIKYVLRIAKTKSEAIKMLGISRRSFYQKLKLYNLENALDE